MIKNLFDKLKDKIKQLYYKNNEMNNLEIGDIVWAKRYYSEEELRKLKEGHTEGPFIIIKKDRKKVYGLLCTSNSHEELKDRTIFFNIDRYKYNFKCESYINTTIAYPITKYNYLYTMTKIDNADLNKVRKALYLNYKKENKYLNKNDLKYKICKGDIIKYKNRYYYILDENDKDYILLKTRKDKTNTTLLINNAKWHISFDNIIKLSKHTNIEFSFFASDKERELIDELYTKWLKEETLRKKVSIGKLVNTDEDKKLCYIYGENDNDFLAFIIYRGAKDILEFDNIKISNYTYHTSFEKINLPKKKNYNIIAMAKTIEEIRINEKLKNINKKDKIKNESLEENKEIFKKYTIGAVIIENDTLDKYVIIKRREDNITIINMDTNDIRNYDLDINDIKFDFYNKLKNLEFENFKIKYKNIISNENI